MKRVVLAAPDLSGEALAELKSWLAISSSQEDAALIRLLHSAVDQCEAFTGQMPLESQCEEAWPAAWHWRVLSTCPVQAITSLQALDEDGNRSAIDSGDYEIDLDSEGSARFRLLKSIEHRRLVIGFSAGLAPDWGTLTSGLRNGIMRQAAHHYRRRDQGEDAATPLSAARELWRPWRIAKLT